MYSPEERLIFGPYPRGDGGEPVYADPIRVRRRLTAALDGDPGKVIAQAQDQTIPQLASEATERLLAAAVHALELVPFDPQTGEGCTEDVVMAALNDFLDWCEQKKTTGGTPQTSPPSTEAPSWEEDGSPTAVS